MITEQQQEQATRYALGEMTASEQREFAEEARKNSELCEFLWSLQQTLDQVALSVPKASPNPALKDKVLRRIREKGADKPARLAPGMAVAVPGLRFAMGEDTGWKALPIPGAFIKLLSLDRDRGYAVLLGKLHPGARYPAHINAGPEDFYILTGDLHVGMQVLGPGDFHHADAGSAHEENHSVEGCTLLAVLTTDDPLVAFAMAG
jgi:anti-sigma factor ChrR (cupin superfamily)